MSIGVGILMEGCLSDVFIHEFKTNSEHWKSPSVFQEYSAEFV